MNFTSKNEPFEHLRKVWTSKHRNLQDKIWDKHKESLSWIGRTISPRSLALGSLGGLLLLTAPQSGSFNTQIASTQGVLEGVDTNVLLADQLKDIVPKEVRPLDKTEEGDITKTLSQVFGFKVTSELEGIKLNRNYGLIGGEQHLYRYPGDNLQAHADSSGDWAKYGGSGIAPGLGAWGYFAPSKLEFTEKDKQKERYYLAIQTFLAPGFVENVGKYRDFFKHRKMLIVNPKTGQAVVAVIGDAGPAEFTGKHLGGSPEVMDVVGLAGGPRKGAVLYFFIDDPKDEIPLGPIKIKNFS
ncbi:hypothetical protein A3A45_03640 [Candidatus Daviesbacteria bacterium RIFCSPLOWO2_01_FULL_36_8]|nr:MAG: hypothetical protein A3A45_03640 [Candidatus Daviesbacteria bacterium RIFCSPLOWO2_01_FULL_36_8]